MAALLVAAGLRVRRGRRVLIDDAQLELVAGDRVHLRGANGAGKSTLLRVLAGLDPAARGRVEALGTRALVPEKVRLGSGLGVGRWLEGMRALRRGPPVAWAQELTAAGLDPSLLARPAGRLSQGMLQRVVLVEALAGPAGLLLLDEPFAGLDEPGVGWLAERIAGRAGAVLFTDHGGATAGRLAPTQVVAVEHQRLRAAEAPAPTGRALRPRRDAVCVTGVFADAYNAVGDSWGLTGVLAAGLAGWLVLATLSAEPPEQRAMATVAVGGPRRRLRAELVLIAGVAAGLAVLFVLYPLGLDAVATSPVWSRPVEPGDVVAALVTNATGASLGGVVALGCAPPRISRPPVAAAVALAVLLGLIAVSVPLGSLGGPVAAARAATDAPAGHLTAAELEAWASTLGLAALALTAYAWLPAAILRRSIAAS